MDVSLDVRKFLRNRRDRAVGSILGYAENEIKPKLTAAQWESLRRVVLDATNSYHDTVLDLVKSEDAARNDHLVTLLERMDRNLTRQEREAIAVADAGHQERKRAIVEQEARRAQLGSAHP
jgi:hypothetical protein